MSRVTTQITASSTRIVGIDVARGAAVLGMFAAHLVFTPSVVWRNPGTWTGLANGRSSILFATLAGVSIGLMTAGRRPRTLELLQSRMKIITRAAMIFVIGALLDLLGTPIAVILGAYAVLFVAMLPFVTWSFRRLVFLTFGSGVATLALYWLWLSPQGVNGEVGTSLFSGTYPPLLWFTFFAAGLTVSRLDLRSTRGQASVLITGIVLAGLGYGSFAILARVVSTGSGDVVADGSSGDSGSAAVVSADPVSSLGEPTPISPADIPAAVSCQTDGSGSYWCQTAGDLTPQELPEDLDCYADGGGYFWCDPQIPVDGRNEGDGLAFKDRLTAMVIIDPHSGSPFEVVGSGGFALTVLGSCLLVCRLRPARAALSPLAAVGSMALTVYVAHVVVIEVTDVEVGGASWMPWASFAAGALVLAWLWRRFFDRGPLERLLAYVGERATAVLPGSDRPNDRGEGIGGAPLAGVGEAQVSAVAAGAGHTA